MLVPEELPPDLRQALIDSLETLSDLLDEETDCLSRAQTDNLDLYLSTKRRLFEQLGVLLREAHRRPASTTIAIEAAMDAEMTEDAGPALAEGDEPVPASPDLLRAAATRLRQSVGENARAVRSVQDALGAVMQHMARVAEREQADGVYGRSGAATRGTVPGYGRVEHQL